MIGAPAAVARSFRQVAAIARRDLRIEVSYQFRFVLRLFEVFFLATTVYFVSDLVGASARLGQYSGEYFEFVLVGLAVVSFAGFGLRAFSQAVNQEQNQGTLEVLLMSPASFVVLLVGSAIVPLCLTVVQVSLLVGIGIGLVGVGFSVSGLLLSLPLFALCIVTFCTLGIFSASLVVLVKRGDPISGPLAQATAFLAGALFPVALLPLPFEVAAHAFPAYYGIEGIRESLLADGGLADIAGELLVLTGFVLVLVPLALWSFAGAVRSARRSGTLGTY